MIVYFVRHGHPDYKNDCLTDLGRKQAEAAAQRLRSCGISRVFSSSKGRAMQTAQYTAELLELPVEPCDFMREISWRPFEGETVPANGNPWMLSPLLAAQAISLTSADWRTQEPFCKTMAVETADAAIKGFDAWLAGLGYTRQGEYYRVSGSDTDRKIAIFSHGGSSSAVLSHMLNIPFPQFCGAVDIDFTSISAIWLSNEQGALVYPKILLLNDAQHIRALEADGIRVENMYGY